MDPRHSSIPDFYSALKPLFVGYSAVIPVLKPGQGFYRAVLVQDRKPLRRDRIWYPPVGKARPNRANRAESPVFYCSSCREVAFFECRTAVGDRFAIVHLTNSADLVLQHVGYSRNAMPGMPLDRHLPGHAGGRGKPRSPQDAVVDEFIAHVFVLPVGAGEEYLYKLPIAISEQLVPPMTGGYRVSGLMYPTIVGSGGSDNVALRSEVADSCLNVEKIEYIEVIGAEGTVRRFNTIDVAHFVDEAGFILWQSELMTVVGSGIPANQHWRVVSTTDSMVPPSSYIPGPHP